MAVSFNIIIADSDANWLDGHQGLRINGKEFRQSTPIIGSTYPKGKGRGNREFTVSFSTMKSHASEAAANSWMGAHAIATGGEANFAGFGLSLVNATCDVDIQHLAGVMTQQTYTIKGAPAPA